MEKSQGIGIISTSPADRLVRKYLLPKSNFYVNNTIFDSLSFLRFVQKSQGHVQLIQLNVLLQALDIVRMIPVVLGTRNVVCQLVTTNALIQVTIYEH